MRVDQRPHAVAEAARRMQIAEARAARSIGVAVRHGHHARFLQTPDVADVGRSGRRIHERKFGGAGVAEDVATALATQHFQQHGRAAA
jgi:hypothetical protein